jgi:hypothetical protein
MSSQNYNMDSEKNVLLTTSWFSLYKTLQPTSTTEYYFSLQSGGVSGEDVGGELYRRPLRSPEVWHLSVGRNTSFTQPSSPILNITMSSELQHGFRKKRSTESQLILTVQDLAADLNKGQQIDAILLDSVVCWLTFIPFLKTGATLACFQSDGICPWSNDAWNMRLMSGEISMLTSLPADSHCTRPCSRPW